MLDREKAKNWIKQISDIAVVNPDDINYEYFIEKLHCSKCEELQDEIDRLLDNAKEYEKKLDVAGKRGQKLYSKNALLKSGGVVKNSKEERL